ncbi:hypothetical protein WI460_05645 [Gemmatimonadota bacterium Y43]|uniref:hypothetical protein n=1 Tax=Gaopeijia maritima TaxID=3119007 RepID=UPI00328B9DEB
MDLTIAADLLLQPAFILDELRLGDGARLRLSLTWYSRGTQARGVLQCAEVTSETTPAVALSGRVLGRDVSGATEVSAILTLIDAGSRPDPIAARRPGSMLWQATERIALGHNLSGFPMMWVDFDAATHLPARAAWHLDWDPGDLDAELDHRTRLLLNSGHPVLAEALANPSSPSSRPVLEFLYHDLGRTLITGALRHLSEDRAAASFSDGSLGRRILELMEAIFPNRRPIDLKARMDLQPGAFDRDLQANLRILQALG